MVLTAAAHLVKVQPAHPFHVSPQERNAAPRLERILEPPPLLSSTGSKISRAL